MNSHDALALQSLCDRVADLGTVVWTSGANQEHVLHPEFFVWKAAAKGHIQIWAQSMLTGMGALVPSEVFMGATAFAYDINTSVLMFREQFEPFGRRWVPPIYSDVREAYELWQFRHELDEDWTPLRRWLNRELFDVDDPDAQLEGRLNCPLYFLSVEDPIASVRAVRWEYCLLAGVVPTQPDAVDPPVEQRIATLCSQEVAAILHIGEQSLRRWRSQGKGPPFVKLEGQAVIYLEASVLEWMAQREVNRASGR